MTLPSMDKEVDALPACEVHDDLVEGPLPHSYEDNNLVYVGVVFVAQEAKEPA
jgi:hypothetical protein